MMVVDPIADMFTRIRNGYIVEKETVVVPYSKIKMEIATLLKNEGYVKDVIKRGRKIKKSLDVVLSYKDGVPAIKKIQRISKPSRRVYVSSKEMYPVDGGYGIRIISTPKGLLTNREAFKEKVGGEVIGEVI
ncbi:MAG: 30S ribosomal protein S8 [Patescibacteria group bacterium]